MGARKAASGLLLLVMPAGCFGTATTPPVSSGALFGAPPAQRGLIGRRAPASERRGIYVSVSSINTTGTVQAYPVDNRHDGGPFCDVTGFKFIWDIATDSEGNLIVPNSLYGINVYKGPQLCGPLAGKIRGLRERQAVDAAAIDALHGRIAIGYLDDLDDKPGSIAVCTLAKGCSANLTNPWIKVLRGVAMAPNGDCWADGWNHKSMTPHLVYYAGCALPGRLASGFENPFVGGLDVDNEGHLLTISGEGPQNKPRAELIVYSGCNPGCERIGGPFPLTPPIHSPREVGGGIFGHLDRANDRFVVADNILNQVDIYKYGGNGTFLKYLYSFKSGLGPKAGPVGAVYSSPP